MNKINTITQELLSYIDTLQVIDTHEHMPSFEADREKPTDVLREYLLHYMNSDLISAGLTWKGYEEACDISLPITKRWKLVEPFWEACRYTGYGRALDETARGLYGIEKIDGTTIEELDTQFQPSLKVGHYKKVLKDLCKIELSILDNTDTPLDSDREYFRSAYRLDRVIFPHTWEDIYMLEERSGVSIVSLNTYLQACTELLQRAKEKSVIALKIALAYERTLQFDRSCRTDAEKAFQEMLSQRHIPTWEPHSIIPGKAFQDYVMHHILEASMEFGFPFQIHTGIQEGNGNHLSNSDPKLLTNLLLEYPEIQFDLFHISYPFFRSAGVLAKNFPNVCLDMCWAHIVSSAASVQALIEWLDLVPYTKIFGFGGDFLFVDGVYGHLQAAKRNIAAAFAVKIEEEVMDLNAVKNIITHILYTNPKRFFGLS